MDGAFDTNDTDGLQFLENWKLETRDARRPQGMSRGIARPCIPSIYLDAVGALSQNVTYSSQYSKNPHRWVHTV